VLTASAVRLVGGVALAALAPLLLAPSAPREAKWKAAKAPPSTSTAAIRMRSRRILALEAAGVGEGVGVGIGERIGFQGDWRWAAALRSLAKALCRGQGSCRLPGVLARSWPVGPLSSPDSDGVRGHQADIIATARLTAVAVCKDR